MKKVLFPQNTLAFVLWIIAFHSFCVGVGMIFMPSHLMEFFGFSSGSDCFFRYQGGVFHIVMSTAYAGGAVNIARNKSLILLTITAKFLATVFLFSYYFFAAKVWMVLLSGIGDMVMGLAVLLFFIRYNRQAKAAIN